jgi:hypothetical protein
MVMYGINILGFKQQIASGSGTALYTPGRPWGLLVGDSPGAAVGTFFIYFLATDAVGTVWAYAGIAEPTVLTLAKLDQIGSAVDPSKPNPQRGEFYNATARGTWVVLKQLFTVPTSLIECPPGGPF